MNIFLSTLFVNMVVIRLLIKNFDAFLVQETVDAFKKKNGSMSDMKFVICVESFFVDCLF